MQNPLSKLLNLRLNEKEKLGVVHTPAEIAYQTSFWRDSYQRVKGQTNSLQDFITDFLKEKKPYIIFTGAGTSEFIGLCLTSLYIKSFNIPCYVVPSPELVVCPENYLINGATPLLISFARSGNSPESIGAVKFVNDIYPETRNIIITCNKDGNLYKQCTKLQNVIKILLNEKTNDMGLAMTSSFTNLLVAGQAIAHYNDIDYYEKKLKSLIGIGNTTIENSSFKAEELSKNEFSRAVFLGSGAHYGIAKESALKLQELTSGMVMCAYETFLGFRHGPEALVNNKTLVVGYLSIEKYRAKYELELLNELKKKNLGAIILAIGESSYTRELEKITEHIIKYDQAAEWIDDDIIPPAYVPIAQLLGVFKSLELGLKPDIPSETGAIHRVVKGVRVYDYLSFKNKKELKIISQR